MGDDMNFEYAPSDSCSDAVTVRDCDGDYFTRCLSSKDCLYKDSIRDCDGDWFNICNK